MTVCHSEVPVSKIALVIPMCMWTNIMSCTLLKTIHYKILKLTDKSSKEGEKNCHNNLLLNILEKNLLQKPFSSKQGKWKLLQKNKNYSTVHKNALPFQNTWNTSISLISLCINTPWSSVLCCYTVLIIMLTTDWDGGTVLTSPHFSLQSGSPLTVLWDVGQFIGPRQKRSLSVHVNSVTHQSLWSGLVPC